MILDLRPLDPVRSIKAKLGLLVVASNCATALLLWYGLVHLGWRPRYTLPVALLAALLVTQLLAHGMTKPLRKMTAAARAMATGDYSRRVRATGRDEVGQLAAAFNRMAADLAAVESERRELLGNVGHELRTPLAAVRAQVENLVDGVRPADGEALRELLEQVVRLDALLEDLLDLARAEAGPARLDPGEVPVQPLLAPLVTAAGTARPGRTWTLDVKPPELVAYVDPGRLQQVVANLLDNAGRHAPTGGSVRVAARGAGAGGLVIDVEDDGPGIPPADRTRVFERFIRGGGDEGGTGLGLAIARWAVALHGGHIAVLDRCDGRPGCRLRVELPGRNR